MIKPGNIKREGIINALLSFDMYFKRDPDVKIYGTFNGFKNLLFKVSERSVKVKETYLGIVFYLIFLFLSQQNGTIGLAAYNEPDLGPAVDNYNQLFKEIKAHGSAFTAIPFTFFIYATLLLTIFVNSRRQ